MGDSHDDLIYRACLMACDGPEDCDDESLLGELYADLCRAADIIISEYPVHDHRYKEAEGWIMNSLADARRALNIETPNDEVEFQEGSAAE